MNKNTVLTIYIKAEQAAMLLRVLEKGECLHPHDVIGIAEEIRAAVRREETTADVAAKLGFKR